MAVIDLNTFLGKVKSHNPCGRYIFAGEEEYLKRYYMSVLKGAVVEDDSLAVFNHIVYDGGEVDFAALTDAVKSPPMMSEYKLVEWRYADFGKMREDELRALERLVEVAKEHPYTVLAFVATVGSIDFGTGKRKGKFLSRFESKFDILRFERSTDRQLYSWLKKHFDAEGISVGAETVAAMVERCGHSMDTLSGEVAKLCVYALAHGRKEVTPEDVTEVCSSVPESDTFAFSNAITERNRAKAFSALEEMKIRRVDHAIIFAMAQRTYSELLDVSLLLDEGRSAKDIEQILKMNQYKLKIYLSAVKKHGTKKLAAAIAALSKADVASKSGGIGGYTAVELFVSEHI